MECVVALDPDALKSAGGAGGGDGRSPSAASPPGGKSHLEKRVSQSVFS